jgi:DNA-directed RNA polymerase specialized sigma24 family protein
MLIDEARTRELLSRIVYRLSADAAARDDLMQEALLHLWLVEAKRPGQTRSWYLQSCKYQLQNYITAGKSVDSPKRKNGKLRLGTDDDAIEAWLVDRPNEETVLALVSARDIFVQLSGQLTAFERSILNLLAEGLGAREIAARLKVTHPTIIKYRRRIAAMAMRLGIPPMRRYQRNGAVVSVS